MLSEISQTQKVHFTQFVLHVDLKKIIIFKKGILGGSSDQILCLSVPQTLVTCLSMFEKQNIYCSSTMTVRGILWTTIQV